MNKGGRSGVGIGIELGWSGVFQFMKMDFTKQTGAQNQKIDDSFIHSFLTSAGAFVS